MISTALPEFSLREFLVFYYRHRTRLILAFLIPFTFFCVVSFLPVPRYEASSVLIVRLGSEYVYQPEVTGSRSGPENAIPFDREQIFKSEVAILGSDDLHQQVIGAMGLGRLYPEIGKASFLQPLREYWSEVLVYFGAQALTDEEKQRYMLAKALKRLDKRLDIKLEKESAVITVTFEHANAALAVETLGKLLDLYQEKRKQLYLEPRVEMAQTQLEDMHEKSLATEQALETFKKKHGLYSLSDQRAALLQDRGELQKKEATINNPALQEKVSFFNRQLDRLDAEEREYDRLQREKQIAEDEYALAAHKLNEALAFESLERARAGSVRMIQPPTVPAEPKRWQWLIILAGFFISGLFALGTAAFTEFMHGGFLTPERLERKTGLPVLTVLSYRD